MLIIPSGHWQEEATPAPRKITKRERWILTGVLAVVAILVVTVAISFASKQRTSSNGCIDVSAATVIGGSELYRCGAAARDLCSAPAGHSATDNVSFRRALAEACRKAGLPVPAAPGSD
jgi:flagellar basal body-associated protein FliL